jgi:hypothetical protein
MAPADEH